MLQGPAAAVGRVTTALPQTFAKYSKQQCSPGTC